MRGERDRRHGSPATARAEAVQQVFQLSGDCGLRPARFCRPQRDERLRAALETIRNLPKSTLLILEQFDLALGKSETAPSLVCEGLDRGIRLIAVARPEFAPDDAEVLGLSLSRRLEIVPVAVPEDAELQQILRHWLQRHPLTQEVEVAAEVVPTALRLSQFRRGANPGSGRLGSWKPPWPTPRGCSRSSCPSAPTSFTISCRENRNRNVARSNSPPPTS